MDFLEEEYSEIVSIFKAEGEEQIERINANLLKLEANPNDKEIISALLHDIHSIKGSARMIGLDNVQSLAHKTEDVMIMVKDGSIQATTALIDTLCKLIDIISNIVENVCDKDNDQDFDSTDILKELDAIISGKNGVKKENTPSYSNANSLISKLQQSLNELRAEPNKINNIKNSYKYSRALCEISQSELKDSVESVNNKLGHVIEGGGILTVNEIEEFGEIFNEFIKSVEIKKNETAQEKKGIKKPKVKKAAEKESITTLKNDILATKNQPNNTLPHPDIFKILDGSPIKTIRVDTKKLDQLINQTGELIVTKIKAKERLNEIAKITKNIEEWHRHWSKSKQYLKYVDKGMFSVEQDNEVAFNISNHLKRVYSFFEESSLKISELISEMNTLYRNSQEDDTRLDFIVSELEEMVKSVRVLPLATIFHMFPRTVRDIAREKNKQVELIIKGSETSADKKVIEEIKIPLMHIIRNAVDHGIESPEQRVKLGKNPEGKIMLNAYQKENCVVIEIFDDGRGINVEALKQKAIAKGLLTEKEIALMSEEQLMNIIFLPGFSTEDIITNISGRGVGLDIVNTKISQLNGKIFVKSTLQEGCKIVLQIPFTMATLSSLLVDIEGQKFAIPTSSVEKVVSITPDEVFMKEGRQAVLVQGKTVPICCLSEALDMNLKGICWKRHRYSLIVAQSEGRQVGFIVRKLLQNQKILHKNLNPPLMKLRHISGLTVLSTGELCLILNINELVKTACSKFNSSGFVNAEDAQKCNNTIKRETTNILVVDDSSTIRLMQKNILERAGYNVFLAKDGIDGLSKLSRTDFSLVVSDIQMPGMDGLTLLSNIKKNDKYKDIPVIMLTSCDDNYHKNEASRLGAEAYIVKSSFREENYLEILKNLLGKSSRSGI